VKDPADAEARYREAGASLSKFWKAMVAAGGKGKLACPAFQEGAPCRHLFKCYDRRPTEVWAEGSTIRTIRIPVGGSLGGLTAVACKQAIFNTP